LIFLQLFSLFFTFPAFTLRPYRRVHFFFSFPPRSDANCAPPFLNATAVLFPHSFRSRAFRQPFRLTLPSSFSPSRQRVPASLFLSGSRQTSSASARSSGRLSVDRPAPRLLFSRLRCMFSLPLTHFSSCCLFLRTWAMDAPFFFFPRTIRSSCPFCVVGCGAVFQRANAYPSLPETFLCSRAAFPPLPVNFLFDFFRETTISPGTPYSPSPSVFGQRLPISSRCVA